MSQKVSLEVWILLEAVCNETATRAQREQLREMVTADPDVRRLYFEYVDLHLGCAEIVAARSASPLPAHLRRRTRPRLVPLAIASACVAVAATVLLLARSGTERRPVAELTDERRPRQVTAPPTFRSPETTPPALTTQPEPSVPPSPGSAAHVRGPSVASGEQAVARGSAPVPRHEDVVAILRRVPRPLLTSLRIGNAEDRLRGAACAAEQPSGLMNLFSGAALGDAKRMDEGLRIVEATTPSAKTQWMVGNEGCTARWLAWAALGLDALEGTPAASSFDQRIQRIRQAFGPILSLVRSRSGSGTAVRPFESSVAFIALGRRSGDDKLTKAGTVELTRALRLQQADGTLAARPACDAHLHASDVVLAHALLSLQPDDDVEQAARTAGDWLIRFMQKGGTGLPDATGPDACEFEAPRRQQLQWALAMHGVRFDPVALDLALQVRR